MGCLRVRHSMLKQSVCSLLSLNHHKQQNKPSLLRLSKAFSGGESHQLNGFVSHGASAALDFVTMARIKPLAFETV